jgi:hypothetical protein
MPGRWPRLPCLIIKAVAAENPRSRIVAESSGKRARDENWKSSFSVMFSTWFHFFLGAAASACVRHAPGEGAEIAVHGHVRARE